VRHAGRVGIVSDSLTKMLDVLTYGRPLRWWEAPRRWGWFARVFWGLVLVVAGLVAWVVAA
jgi:hypothetical protein